MKKYRSIILAIPLFLVSICLLSPPGTFAQGPVVGDRTAEYTVGSGAEFSVFDGTYVWIANQFSDTVVKLSAANGSVAGTFSVTGNPLGIAFDGKNIWVSRYEANDVVALDRATGTIVGTVKTEKGPGYLLYNGKDLWVVNRLSKSVQKINPGTGEVTGTYGVGKKPAMMAFDGANIWVANSQSDSVSRINASTGEKAEFKVAGGQGAFGVAFDGKNIWVSNFFGGTIVRISPSGVSGAVYKVGDGVAGMYYANNHMWVVANGDNLIYRVRLLDGVVVNRYQVSASPYGLTFDGQRFWTQASGAGRVSAVTPVTSDALSTQ